MSAVLGVFPTGPESPDPALVRGMLGAMRRRGADRAEVWSGEGAALGVSRGEWELHPGFSGDALVVHDGELAVAADATLFYRDDLRRGLAAADVEPAGDTPGHLILAAYRAWGPECAERLEGDWAFVLWDAGRRQVFAARDFGGKRPLFYAQVPGALLIASSIAALLEHPRCPAELNLAAVAADAAGLFAARHETCRRAVLVLPAGWSLVARDARVRTVRHWEPPPVRTRGGASFADAAEQLRGLLRRSVEERLAPAGPTSVWLSGGWDSTAAFAAGEAVLRSRGGGEHLHAVSISYPPGDPGREDELIQAVTEHWGSPVHWLPIGEVPLLDQPEESAAGRDEPFAHAFEMANRALAAGSRSVGARVAWDGNGGDQLFQVSNVYLADLLRSGQWLALRREWRAKGMRGHRSFFRWAVQPNLPRPLLSLATVLRQGRPLRSNLERPVPDWLVPDFVRRHGLLERERGYTPGRTGASRAAYETRWYMGHPYFPRAFGTVAEFALEAGVEIRSPLLDRRVVEFAAARPVSDRSAGRQTKRLLREAGRGLLPDEVLAPRRTRTGVSSGYFSRETRKRFAPWFEQTLAAPLLLADAGIVSPAVLRQRWADYLRTGDGNLGVNLWLTIQAELWLRGHLRDPTS